jgi:uncharacterized membrane protein YeaQ/YmgE (transglycosylase-associated protein family)
MIWALIVGLFVGLIAKAVMPGKDPGGFIITALLGVAGAAVAHFIGSSMGVYGPDEPVGIIAAILGAVLLLAGYRMIFARDR